jgi:hypothetical protein
MRVIQIQESDAHQLLDKIEALKARPLREEDPNALHRAYWHAIVSWLQYHGVDTTRR